MGFDLNQLNQGGQLDRVLSTLPYPLDKQNLIAHAQQAGANPQVLGAMKQALPDEVYESPEDVKHMIQSKKGQFGM